MTQRADYKNWVPKGMITGLTAGTAALTAAAVFGFAGQGKAGKRLGVLCGTAALACGGAAAWCSAAHRAFSYDGSRQLSRRIVTGTAQYVRLPEGGVGLDVGCGSGALTIACAKRNPWGSMVGLDCWGREYASFSKTLCEENAKAEGVTNVRFVKGDAVKLDFPDETFDAVTSNYVYHNIPVRDRQALLRETLRVLKKGGIFALHDLMEPVRYGDMDGFVKELKDAGYAEVRLLDTTTRFFCSPWEARLFMLSGSRLLVGRK